MPQWQGRSKGNKLGYKIFVFIISRFGLSPAYLLLRFVALYYFLFSPQSSRPILDYFQKRHGYGWWKSRVKLYSNYNVFGQTLIDKIVVLAGIKNRFTFHFDGEENLHEIARQGQGGILISAHLGNWEVAGYLFKRLSTQVHVVMFDGEHERLKGYLEQVTGGRKFNVIVVKDDLSHVYKIGEALQRNELVCLHADRFLDGNKTVIKNFMGAPARFPVGPFAMAGAFKVPVSIVYAFKETNTHYHFYGSANISRKDIDRNQLTDHLMDKFIASLEEKVKKYPDQWFNYYNFWET